jgi:hypothetical protein
MGRINLGGVIKGGLAAGLLMNISEFILNVPVLGPQMDAEFAQRNLPPPTGGAIALFVIITFLAGLITVWLYGAIRPRLGPGPKTAVTAGLVVWVLTYLFPNLAFAALGFASAQVAGIASVWSFVEMVLASLLGGWVYKE